MSGKKIDFKAKTCYNISEGIMRNVDDLKIFFAQNLISLRKQTKITQAELAEKINYSDKAVSKWERGDSIPDVAILKSIADLFGVTIDYLITQHNDEEAIIEQTSYVKEAKRKNHFWIAVLTLVAIVLVATTTFVVLQSVIPSGRNAIYCFVCPLPLCAMMAFIFSAMWGNRFLTFLSVSLFIWLVILSAFFILAFATGEYYPLMFIVGAPAEIITMIGFKIIKIRKIKK